MGIRDKNNVSNQPNMRFVGWDTETHKIRTGCIMPRMVCLSTYEGTTEGLYAREEGIRHLTSLLRDPSVILVAHNAVFDLGVAVANGVPLDVVIDALEAGRVKCTMIREKLLAIAYDRLRFDARKNKPMPGFSLAYCTDVYFGVDISGGKTPKGCICQTTTRPVGSGECPQCKTWRLSYNTLDGVPIEQWPEKARTYAIDDALWALKIYHKQVEIPDPAVIDGYHINDEDYQLRAAFAFHLMAAWGVMVDAPAIDAWEEHLLDDVAALDDVAERLGILRPNGTKNMKAFRAIIEAAYTDSGGELPRTDKGAVSTSRATLLASGNDDLIALADPNGSKKNLTTYMPILRKGASGVPITSSPNILVATGRTSWRYPNWQNPPRAGGFRACVVPRKGRVFVSCDYSAIEMVCMAQILIWMFGSSKMADAVNTGRDLHSVMAANMLGITYEAFIERLMAGDQIAKDTRQGAKIANFGFMGGMAAKTLVAYAEGFGLAITPDRAQELRRAWLATWVQMGPYLEQLGAKARWGNFAAEQFVSLRVRGGCGYTDGANTAFQGLAADGAKAAAWQLMKASYATPSSPLYGSKPVMFIHDEFIMEVPEDCIHECGWAISEIMESAMQGYTPDVRVVAEPAAMRRWEKGAELVVGADGRLICWDPDTKYKRNREGLLTPC